MSVVSRVSRRLPKYRFHRATGKAIVRLDTKVFYLGKFGTAESDRRYDQLLSEWLGAGPVHRRFFDGSLEASVASDFGTGELAIESSRLVQH